MTSSESETMTENSASRTSGATPNKKQGDADFVSCAIENAIALTHARNFSDLKPTLDFLKTLSDTRSIDIFASIGNKNNLVNIKIISDSKSGHLADPEAETPSTILPKEIVNICQKLLKKPLEEQGQLTPDAVGFTANKIVGARSDNYYWPVSDNGQMLCLFVFNDKNQSENMFGNNSDHIKRIMCQLASTIKRINRNSDALKEEDALNQLVSTTDESFSIWTAGAAWVTHNQSICSRLGHPETASGTSEDFDYAGIILDDEKNGFRKKLEECFASKEAFEQEFRVKDVQGKTKIISSRFDPIMTEDSKLERVTAVSVDITENKQKELATLDSVELDHWLLAQTSALYKGRDKAAIKSSLRDLANYFSYSRCILRLFDRSTLSVYTEWHHPDEQSINETFPTLTVQKGGPTQSTYIEDTEQLPKNHRMKERSRKANFRAQMIIPLGTNEQVLGYLICQKNTPHKWLELEKKAGNALAETLRKLLLKETLIQELAKSEERNELILDSASFGIWELNIQENTIFIGPHYFEMLGFSVDKNRGFTPVHFKNVHIDDRELLSDHQRKIKTGEIDGFSLEIRHLSKTGEVIWILMRGRVIYWDDTGRPIRAAGTLTDITTLKRADADLQIAYQEAEAAHVAKSEFLARMSHEIRTPMNAVIGMSYLALQSSLTEQQRAYVEDIDFAAKSLLKIIDDILDFSKIEAGKLQLENRRFNFAKHIERAAKRFNVTAQQKKLSLTTSIDPNLPPYISSDSTRLRQVLTNLLDNAFKFTKTGSVILSTKLIEQKAEKLTIEFTVADSGIGLSKKQIKNLFDPFTQADGSSSREYGGTGLGLAIAKQLVLLMGGDINVDSKPGEGASFKFTIVCDAEAEEDERQNQRIKAPTQLIDQIFTGKKILLVEDNRVNQKVATGILKHKGLDVTLANNGTEAVYIMKASKPGQFSAILMDIEMPYMDGFEATEEIRSMSEHANIAIIAMTAHSVRNERKKYLEKGMSNCISKPILPAELYKILEQYLK